MEKKLSTVFNQSLHLEVRVLLEHAGIDNRGGVVNFESGGFDPIKAPNKAAFGLSEPCFSEGVAAGAAGTRPHVSTGRLDFT